MGTNRNRKGRLFKINLRWWEPKEGKCDEQRLDAAVSRKRSGRVWWLEKNGCCSRRSFGADEVLDAGLGTTRERQNGRKQLQQ